MSTRNKSAQTIVIGAGVVGCAVAHQLAKRGLSPVILERGESIAEGVTSRNSGVIHAGIYYPPKTLKAETCIRGNALLYEWCAKHGVLAKKTGKWIVGAKSEEDTLEFWHQNALKCGAKGLRRGSAGEMKKLQELGVISDVGVYSENSGIVDAYEFTRSLQTAAEELGAQIILNADVQSIERGTNGYRVATTRGELDAEYVVNSAGLHADEIAKMAGVELYEIHPCRGDYFKIPKYGNLSHLIYPIKKKNDPGLGIHLTLGLDGSCKLGPDAEYVPSKTDFSAPLDLKEKRKMFFESARKYLKNLSLEDLQYDTCGIRPKLRPPGAKDGNDFIISEDIPGFVNLVGIESPGLTAALAIAELVSNKIR